jgi:hypothetical protein
MTFGMSKISVRAFSSPADEGSVAKSWGAVANLHGLDVVRTRPEKLTPDLVKAALEHLPGKIAETGVNALILDTLSDPVRYWELSRENEHCREKANAS